MLDSRKGYRGHRKRMYSVSEPTERHSLLLMWGPTALFTAYQLLLIFSRDQLSNQLWSFLLLQIQWHMYIAQVGDYFALLYSNIHSHKRTLIYSLLSNPTWKCLSCHPASSYFSRFFFFFFSIHLPGIMLSQCCPRAELWGQLN